MIDAIPSAHKSSAAIGNWRPLFLASKGYKLKFNELPLFQNRKGINRGQDCRAGQDYNCQSNVPHNAVTGGSSETCAAKNGRRLSPCGGPFLKSGSSMSD
jgi:hypothetical protein